MELKLRVNVIQGFGVMICDICDTVSAINSPEGCLQEWWNIFYEAFSSRFPEVALFAAESFDKVLPIELF